MVCSQDRFFNFWIDHGVIKLIITTLQYFYKYLIHGFDLNHTEYIIWLEDLLRDQDALFFVLILIPYYYFFEHFTGRTIGKYISKTMVVDINGNNPNKISILKRTLARIIPFEGISFFGNERGWHDSLSKTYVIYT